MPEVLADPAPVVCFSGFGKSSLDIELGVWSEEMSYRPRHFRSDLNFAIERKLREAARLMTEHRVHRLVVVAEPDGGPVGVISESDVVREVAALTEEE